jgi:hypothetical protein
MRYLFIYMAMHGNESLEAFRRPTNTIPINAEDPIGEGSQHVVSASRKALDVCKASTFV